MKVGDNIELQWVKPLNTLVVKVEKIDDVGIRGIYRPKESTTVYPAFSFNWANIKGVNRTALRVEAVRDFYIDGISAKVGPTTTKLGALILTNSQIHKLSEFIKEGAK